jgi:hypothetical protein
MLILRRLISCNFGQTPIEKYALLSRRPVSEITFAERWGEEWPASSPAVGQPVCLQALLQQFDQRRSGVGLSLGRDLSNERLNRTLDQNAQDYVRVHADRAGHADRLSKDVRWVGSVGGDALNSADKCLDGGKRTVWHVVRVPDWMAVRQDASDMMFLICSMVWSSLPT